MAVVEPKIDNSGMRSGTLIKRHRFPRADETEKLVSPADLRVGTTFIAYGKTFALTACDAFTRVSHPLMCSKYQYFGVFNPSTAENLFWETEVHCS